MLALTQPSVEIVEIPQSETALFLAISLHQPPSGKKHSYSRTNDHARITHPFE